MGFLQTIHETFTEPEMLLIKEAKGNLTWHEFIIQAAELFKTNKSA